MSIFQEELKLIYQYFPELLPEQRKQIELMQEIYLYWNERINVVSRKDIEHLYLHHVLHSLSIAKILQFQPNASVLDIGTGGGFPGIPLAILYPQTQFFLNDSVQKKINVVNEVVRVLQLKNVTTIHNRAEKIKQKFDFIVSRAVTNFPDFLKLAQGKIKNKHHHALPNGIIYLKGGEIEDLRAELGKYFEDVLIFNIYDFFKHEYFETKRIIHYAMIK